jgi:predicted extracellular nuclease
MAATNLFLFDTDDFLQVTPGAAFADLCGPIRYTFEEYKVAPRSADDYEVSLVACADSATPATIQEVQQGMFMEDELVLIEDVVVTTPWSFSMQQFFVQDPAGGPYSGIQVYVPTEGDYVPMPGDLITVCGAYTEYFDQSQIQISSAADLVAAGNGPVPAPEVLTADELAMDPPAEQWEGVLVRVDDVTVTAEADIAHVLVRELQAGPAHRGRHRPLSPGWTAG